MTLIERKYMTSEELKKFFTIIKNDWKMKYYILFFCIYYLAARVTEICNLRVWDYDKNKWSIYLRRWKGSLNKEYILPKWFNKIMYSFLEKREETEAMFTWDWTKYTRQNITFHFKKYCRYAWLSSHFSVHSLKHSIAVTLADKGLDPYELKDWMGHKNIQNTFIYYHMSDKKQAEYLKKVWDFKDV